MEQAGPELAAHCEPQICEVGGGGVFLPFLPGEQDWDPALRSVLYLCGLLYFFMGVAIVADVFMGAIENITSKKISIKEPNGKRTTFKVWNATVANLTLMALGSSAPEILLSVIELLSGGFFSGELGPSTIVGSAAFNLHCIVAVCVAAIPPGQVRRIADMNVFIVTASFSILAYLWLYFIVLLNSKDVIEVWEGAVTFALFPVLVLLAYAADKGYCGDRKTVASKVKRSRTPAVEMSQEELAVLKNEAIRVHGNGLSDENMAKLLEVMAPVGKSRAAYRVDATRMMSGGQRVHKPSKHAMHDGSYRNLDSPPPLAESGEPKTTIRFPASDYAVMENIGAVKIYVGRTGDTSQRDQVDYKTEQTAEGKAQSGKDYKHTQGTLTFEPGQEEAYFEVVIFNDDSHEDLESFDIVLSDARRENGHRADIGLGNIFRTKVSIVDDDDPGALCFDCEYSELRVTEEVKSVVIYPTVIRKGGSKGDVSCSYRTEPDTAIAGEDYGHVEGTLEFKDGQRAMSIRIEILPKGKYEDTEEFRLVLDNVKGGRFLEDGDGGNTDSQVLTIVIEPDPAERTRLDNILGHLHFNYDKAKLGYHSYADQFKSALMVNGGETPAPEFKEDSSTPLKRGECDVPEEKPSCADYTLHFICLPWKLLFAFIPPAGICGGWLCFAISLCAIGFVTAFIGDLAALLGCVLGIPDSITAITFVALGTSLPDTFASKSAAIQDETADASIGNVTGSNSVNVFLGLGLPWLIGSVYWAMMGRTAEWQTKYSNEADFASWDQQGGKFIVVGGDLGFSVGVFSITAVLNIIVLGLRRRLGGEHGGELGGEVHVKWATAIFLATLWLTYVSLSSWKTLSSGGGDAC